MALTYEQGIYFSRNSAGILLCLYVSRLLLPYNVSSETSPVKRRGGAVLLLLLDIPVKQVASSCQEYDFK